jgi:hypothetical protein
MDLMTQLQSEKHISYELGHRLGHQEEELNEIRHQVSPRKSDRCHRLIINNNNNIENLYNASQNLRC